MKKTIFLLLSITICFGNLAQGQDTIRLFGHQKKQLAYKETQYTNSRPPSDIKTLTGSDHSLGFYIGLHSEYSQIAGYDAFGAGGTFAMIANHGLAFGFSGKGFFTEPFGNIPGSNTSYCYTGGYGGFLVEPIVFPKFPVHVSFPILVGAGGIAKSILTNHDYTYDNTDVFVENSEAFLIAEPGVELEYNVARWLRFGLGASYRFTTTFDSSVFDSNPLEGFTGGFSLKFGKF
jgi:hypothetical protein